MSNTINISSTLQAAHKIKQNLEDQIRCITNQPEIFAQSPLDFSRNRKLFSLSVDKVFLVNYSLTLILHFKRQLLPHLYRLEVK
ncbi:hypothetical protein IGJ81_000357 [Enterococcus sp. AZ162]